MIPMLSLLLYFFNFYSQILSYPFDQALLISKPFFSNQKAHKDVHWRPGWKRNQVGQTCTFCIVKIILSFTENWVLYSLFCSLLPFLSISNYGSNSNLLLSLSFWFYDSFFHLFEFWVFKDQIYKWKNPTSLISFNREDWMWPISKISSFTQIIQW